MRYQLIKDLPDIEKGLVFMANTDGTVYYAYYGPRIICYPDYIMKKKEWFKKI